LEVGRRVSFFRPPTLEVRLGTIPQEFDEDWVRNRLFVFNCGLPELGRILHEGLLRALSERFETILSLRSTQVFRELAVDLILVALPGRDSSSVAVRGLELMAALSF
jgi:hypothetical protein